MMQPVFASLATVDEPAFASEPQIRPVHRLHDAHVHRRTHDGLESRALGGLHSSLHYSQKPLGAAFAPVAGHTSSDALFLPRQPRGSHVHHSVKKGTCSLRVRNVALRLFFFLTYVGTMIDLASCIPFYIETFLQVDSKGTIVLRILRLTRAIRILRVSTQSRALQVLIRTLRASLSALGLLLAYIVIATIFFGSLMYFAEQGTVWDPHLGVWLREAGDGGLEPTPFQSIPHSMWFVVVTLSTTGFGDAVPVTGWGKLIASCLMFSGTLLTALPISILAGRFPAEFERYQRELAAAASARAERRLRERTYAQRMRQTVRSLMRSTFFSRKINQSVLDMEAGAALSEPSPAASAARAAMKSLPPIVFSPGNSAPRRNMTPVELVTPFSDARDQHPESPPQANATVNQSNVSASPPASPPQQKDKEKDKPASDAAIPSLSELDARVSELLLLIRTLHGSSTPQVNPSPLPADSLSK
jgi:hypothetical protein